MKNNLTLKPFLILPLAALLLSALACDTYYSVTCRVLDGGKWTYDMDNSEWYCDYPDKDEPDAPDRSQVGSDRSGDDQPEEAEAASSSVTSQDIAACLPKASDYKLTVTNHRDQTTTSGEKRSCNARGQITNTGEKPLMFAVYRVNHYGAEVTFGEKWLGAGYKVLENGDTMEYGRFHRCTGGNCGEGEWFYIKHLSLLYYSPECSKLVIGQEEKIPDTIVPINDPCFW